jgi:hypothetical protein
MYSTLGEMEIAPRSVRAGTGQALEIRQRVQRHIHFAGRSAELVAIDFFEKVAPADFGFLDQLIERERGSTLEETTSA